jgi:nucleoside-diphosphate-sugar epimerase
MARKVLVTGGTGFIGSKLESTSNLEYLKIGSEIDFLKSDGIMRIISLAIKNNCDAILHLAWISNSQKNYENNPDNLIWYTRTIEFAASAIKANLLFISIGTGAESESENQTLYVQSKRLTKHKLSNLTPGNLITWIRLFYIVDINERRPRIINELFKNDGDKIIMYGSVMNDYIFIEDVISGIDFILANNIFGEIDLGSGFLTSNRELVTKICNLTDAQLPIIENNSRSNGEVAIIEKLTRLGWNPTTTTEFFQTRGI